MRWPSGIQAPAEEHCLSQARDRRRERSAGQRRDRGEAASALDALHVMMPGVDHGMIIENPVASCRPYRVIRTIPTLKGADDMA